MKLQKKNRAAALGFVCAVMCGGAASAEESAPGPSENAPSGDPQQVIVAGPPRDKTRASSEDIAAASTVVPESELRSAGATPASVLARIPGAQVARAGTSSDLATVQLRGATSAQTPVYLAGIRLNDDVTGTTDLSKIPLWMISRAEVFRGNAPGQSDQLGLGGAVFFEPATPTEDRVGAGVGAGSFGEFSLWALGAVKGESASALFGVRRERAENDFPYVSRRPSSNTNENGSSPVELRKNADAEAYDAWAVGRFSAGRADIRSVFSAFDREQGLAGTDDFPAEYTRARARRMLGGLNIGIPCAAPDANTGQAPCSLRLTTTLAASHGRIDDPYREILGVSRRFENAGTRFSQAARLQYDAMDTLQLSIQASQSAERVEIRRDTGPGLSAKRFTTRAVGTVQWALSPRLSLLGLGAIECHRAKGKDSLSARDQGLCGAAFSPMGRMGARIVPHEHIEILANVGRYVRVPTLAELYGSSFFIGGNPTLVPESGWSADVGLRAFARGFLCESCQAYLDVFGFLRWASNMIAFVPSSFGLVRPYNRGDARFVGIEMAGWIEAWKHLHVEASATLMDPRNTTEDSPYEGNVLPFRSPQVVSPYVEGFWDLSRLNYTINRMALGARLLYRSFRYDGESNGGFVPEQTTVDLEASLLSVRRRLSLRFAVRNLLDARFFDFYQYPLPGRSIHIFAEGFW